MCDANVCDPNCCLKQCCKQLDCHELNVKEPWLLQQLHVNRCSGLVTFHLQTFVELPKHTKYHMWWRFTVNAIVKFRWRRWRIQGLNPQEVQDSNFMRVPQTDAHSVTGVSLTNNCHHENICEHWIVFFQGPSSVPRSSTNLSSIPFHCEWPFANWAWIFCFSTVFSCSDIRFGVQLSTLV